MVDFTDVLNSLVGGGLAGYPSTSGGSPIGMPALPGAGGGSPIGFVGLASGGSPIGLPALAGFESSPIGLPLANLKAETLLGRGALFRADQAAKAKAAQEYTPGAQAAAVARAALARPGAPAPGGPIDFSSRAAYLRTAMPYFQQIEARTGIPAESLAAISINEGATVPGTLAHSSGAPFGIKSTGQDPATGLDLATGYPVTRTNAWEVRNGQNVSEPSAFINFGSADAAIQGFVDFLQRNPRYAPALQAAAQGTTPQAFHTLLAQAGYATDPAWTAKLNAIATEAAAYRVAQPAAAPAPGGAITGISQNTYAAQNGLPRDIAAAICGPTAVDAFARNHGRNPGPAEAFNLARDQGLWDLSSGAHGPDSMVTLLGRMGVPAKTTAPTQDTIAREVQRGHMVIIDTPQHYYQVVGYDPDSGRFQFGDAVGANRWTTLDRLAAWNYGAPRTAIVSTE